MKLKNITTIMLLSIWVPTLTLYAEPSSGEKEHAAQLQDTITSITQQATRLRHELQNAEDRLQEFSGENRIDLEEWLQAYSERIIELKKNYVEMVENDYAAKQDSEETEKIKHLIDHLQAQRAELLRKEREYLKLERDVERLQTLYELVLNQLKEMDFSAANKELKATADAAP